MTASKLLAKLKPQWLLVAVFAFAFTSASADERPPLRVITFGLPWYAKAEHGGFFQAKATGIYEKYGLKVNIKEGGPKINNLQLLVAGKHDITSGYPIQAINGVHEGLPVTTVAAWFQKDPQVIITQSEINSLDELKGGTILVANYAENTYWPWLVEQYDFTDSMKRPYTGGIQRFMVGEVDAQQGYVTNEPYTISEKGKDFNVFLMADLGYPPYTQTFQVKPSLVENDPELVKDFVQATAEGYESYFENPEPANELIQKVNPEMDQERIDYSIEKMKEYNILTSGAAGKNGIGWMTDERWKKTYDFMVRNDLVPADVDYKKAYTLEFLPDDPRVFVD